MDIDSAKKFVEKNGGDYESIVDSMPARFIDPMVTHGLKIDEVERGRVLCSYAIPPRILNTGNTLHGGAIATLVDVIGSVAISTMIPGSEFSGVSVDISVSYLDSA
ncbi:thioesterase family protein, partial [Genlisea aurea]